MYIQLHDLSACVALPGILFYYGQKMSRWR